MPWSESPADLKRARQEKPVVVDSPHGALYGIFTPPDPEAPPAGTCAVFCTRPRSHRNRVWVEGARRLAAGGFGAFRFDYHGQGDSEGESGFLNPEKPYRDDAVAVLRHLTRHLAQRRFVLVGMCFDARTALSAFPEAGSAIEAIAFLAAPLVDLGQMENVCAERRSWRDVLLALRDRRRWRELRDPARRRQVVGISTRMGAAREARAPSPSFQRDFEALVRSGAKALFLYGEQDREYDTFLPVQRDWLPRLPDEARRRIQVEVWPGEIHGGTRRIPRQRETLERVLAWILALHPGAGPGESGSPAAGRRGAGHETEPESPSS
jgi:pimeloyl-ACP methyl ester carboxylesterase